MGKILDWGEHRSYIVNWYEEFTGQRKADLVNRCEHHYTHETFDGVVHGYGCCLPKGHDGRHRSPSGDYYFLNWRPYAGVKVTARERSRNLARKVVRR